MSEDRPAVFVIDDDPSMRRSLDTLLRSVALDVHIFSSTQEFMHAKRPEAPGCLVLDVRLPGMSGLTFQQEITKAGVMRKMQARSVVELVRMADLIGLTGGEGGLVLPLLATQILLDQPGDGRRPGACPGRVIIKAEILRLGAPRFLRRS